MFTLKEERCQTDLSPTTERGPFCSWGPYFHHLSLMLSKRNRLMTLFARQIILVEADTTVENFCGTFSESDISSNKMYSCLTFIKVGGERERNIMILRDGEMASFEQRWKNVLESFYSGLHQQHLWLFTLSWNIQNALKNSHWNNAGYSRLSNQQVFYNRKQSHLLWTSHHWKRSANNAALTSLCNSMNRLEDKMFFSSSATVWTDTLKQETNVLGSNL